MKLDLPLPRDWQVFEDLCRDLWAELWGDPNAQKHGRSGEKQLGVDVFGQPAGGGGAWEGVQCKRYRSQLTRKQIEREVVEARKFKPPLRRLIVATTTKRDTGAQQRVREISGLDADPDRPTAGGRSTPTSSAPEAAAASRRGEPSAHSPGGER